MVPQARRQWGIFLIGIMLFTASCGISAPVASTAAPTQTAVPLVTPTADPAPTNTATPAIAGCPSPAPFTTPPGPLPPHVPLPAGTYVETQPMGINAGAVQDTLCTPGTTQAAITQFMNSALPAAGWKTTGGSGCNGAPYQWFQGTYGMTVQFFAPPPSNFWALVVCPHIGG